MCTLEKGKLQRKSERRPIAGDAQSRTKLRGPSKLYRLVALMNTDVCFPLKPHVWGQKLVHAPGNESGIVGRPGWDLSYTSSSLSIDSTALPDLKFTQCLPEFPSALPMRKGLVQPWASRRTKFSLMMSWENPTKCARLPVGSIFKHRKTQLG